MMRVVLVMMIVAVASPVWAGVQQARGCHYDAKLVLNEFAEDSQHRLSRDEASRDGMRYLRVARSSVCG